MLMRLVFLLAVICGSGCASIIDVPLEKLRIRNEIMAAAQQVNECADRVKQEPKYARINFKLAVDVRTPPTPAQIGDADRPDESDVELGMGWFSQVQACNHMAAEKFGRIDPELGTYVVGNLADNVMLFSEVITTRPTFGYINSKIKALNEKRRVDMAQWGKSLDFRLNQIKAQQETASAAAVSGFLAAVLLLSAGQTALAQAQQRYAIVTPTYRPSPITNTTCSYIGRNLHCSTY